jgi:mevalonate kinase
MAELSGAVSAPGVLHLFGEYSTLFGEPAVAIAIDLRLTLTVEPAEFEFSIVDGYKLDPRKHKYFDIALQEFWEGPPLEFSTSSQIPMLSGLGTSSALTVAITGLLLELNRSNEKKPKLKKKQSKTIQLAKRAYKLEKKINPPVSPLGTSTAIAGGAVLLFDIPAGALWSIPEKNRTSYIHKLEALEGVSIVIGHLKDKSTANYSALHPRALFDSPTAPAQSKSTLISDAAVALGGGAESIQKKLQRLTSKSGFIKDIIRELGKVTRSGVQALTSGDPGKIGTLLNKQQNLVTMLGVYPSELKDLAEAAEDYSFGVTPAGAIGDTILALTRKPELVASNIQKAGGDAVITNVTSHGYTLM